MEEELWALLRPHVPPLTIDDVIRLVKAIQEVYAATWVSERDALNKRILDLGRRIEKLDKELKRKVRKPRKRR